MLIELRNINVKENGKDILRNLSFSVKKAEKVCLTGSSGAGKSSVLKTLIGVHVPESGEIVFDGRTLNTENIGDMRKRVSYIGQVPFVGASNVRNSLLIPYGFSANAAGMPKEEEIKKVVENLMLDSDILERKSEVLSGGEKQRIAIAREILQGKDIFILDEISSALDKSSKEAVIGLFKGSEYTIISVSHDKEWIEAMDTVVEMSDGRISDVQRSSL